MKARDREIIFLNHQKEGKKSSILGLYIYKEKKFFFKELEHKKDIKAKLKHLKSITPDRSSLPPLCFRKKGSNTRRKV